MFFFLCRTVRTTGRPCTTQSSRFILLSLLLAQLGLSLLHEPNPSGRECFELLEPLVTLSNFFEGYWYKRIALAKSDLQPENEWRLEFLPRELRPVIHGNLSNNIRWSQVPSAQRERFRFLVEWVRDYVKSGMEFWLSLKNGRRPLPDIGLDEEYLVFWIHISAVRKWVELLERDDIVFLSSVLAYLGLPKDVRETVTERSWKTVRDSASDRLEQPRNSRRGYQSAYERNFGFLDLGSQNQFSLLPNYQSAFKEIDYWQLARERFALTLAFRPGHIGHLDLLESLKPPDSDTLSAFSDWWHHWKSTTPYIISGSSTSAALPHKRPRADPSAQQKKQQRIEEILGKRTAEIALILTAKRIGESGEEFTIEFLTGYLYKLRSYQADWFMSAFWRAHMRIFRPGSPLRARLPPRAASSPLSAALDLGNQEATERSFRWSDALNDVPPTEPDECFDSLASELKAIHRFAIKMPQIGTDYSEERRPAPIVVSEPTKVTYFT